MNPVQRGGFEMSLGLPAFRWILSPSAMGDLDWKWHEKSFDTCFYNWTWSCYHKLILVTGIAWLSDFKPLTVGDNLSFCAPMYWSLRSVKASNDNRRLCFSQTKLFQGIYPEKPSHCGLEHLLAPMEWKLIKRNGRGWAGEITIFFNKQTVRSATFTSLLNFIVMWQD